MDAFRSAPTLRMPGSDRSAIVESVLMSSSLGLPELVDATRLGLRIQEIREHASSATSNAGSVAELRKIRARFVGRRSELRDILRKISRLPTSERAAVGLAANRLRDALDAAIASKWQLLAAAELEERLAGEGIDLTFPGVRIQKVGRLHLLTQTQRDIEDIFIGLGFKVIEGPEVETVYNNFDALNHPPVHPARDPTDTFYVSEGVLLRTHTSPMQIRAMQEYSPPLFVISPGRVYRRDSDATHMPQFHQVEGLAVGQDITVADLKGTLLEFVRQTFGPDRDVRLRSHFFPFTEPSVEIDVACFNCKGGYGRDGSRCYLCKGEQWLEILGAGQIHPRVLEMLGDPEYDPQRVQGFVWGLGVERIAMLKHGLSHLRLFFDNDVWFLEQFG